MLPGRRVPVHTAARAELMDPQGQFCHNRDCPARGQVGHGNIGLHSQVEQRYVCRICGGTFAATTGTPFYRLRTAADQVTLVLPLLTGLTQSLEPMGSEQAP